MNIYRYLQQIKADKPVNAMRLDELLHQHALSLEMLGKPSFVSRNKYLLESVDNELLAQWLERFAPATSRVDASRRAKDSHQHRTSAAYFTARLLSDPDNHFAIACGASGASTGHIEVPADAGLVLIENSECYTQHERFLLNVGLGDLSPNTVILLSGGNAITHPAALTYLSQFPRIHYCPDYDLAGIEIYETASQTLAHNLHFVMPDDLVSYARYCKKPKHQAHYLKAIEKARYHNFDAMVELLIAGQGVLEQEALIGEDK